MYHSSLVREVEPLPASAIPLFRTRLLSTGFASRARISAPQGLLLSSLGYGGGARTSELSRMQVAHLLDENGNPAENVRFYPDVTKHWVSRRVPMHPDIRRDLENFLRFHPHEQFVAFAAGRSNKEICLPKSTIDTWFRHQLRAAGLGKYSAASFRKTFLATQPKVA